MNANDSLELQGAYRTRSPYDVDRYNDRGSRPRGAVSHAVGMVCCIVAMAVLCLGMLYLMWKTAGK